MTALEILQAHSADDLASAVAGLFVATVVQRQADGLPVHVVLTGGGIGTAVLQALNESPNRDAIDWHRVHVWWGDERYLPTGDPERNETSARAALLDHVDLDPELVHPIPGPDATRNAEDAAEDYARALAEVAGSSRQIPDFDIVLLGLGPDTHVASLFPESPAVHEHELMVVAVHGSPKPPPTRVTLTLPAINAARQAWLLASGREKSEAVRLLVDAAAGPLQVPAAGVRAQSRTVLFVDREAATAVPGPLVRPIA